MSINDSYMSIPGNNNTWGGAAKKKKTTKKKTTKKKSTKLSPQFRNWIKFAKEYRKEMKKKGLKANVKQISASYRSMNCGKSSNTKKFKSLCPPTRIACKRYTIKLKNPKLKKSLKSSIRKRCVGYTRKRRGRGMMGGECAVCRGTGLVGGGPFGAGMMGGCACCGGTGQMEEDVMLGEGLVGGELVGEGMMGGFSKPRPRRLKRNVLMKKGSLAKTCLSNQSLLNRLEEMREELKDDAKNNTLTPIQRAKLTGAYRQAMSMYMRGNLIGDKFLTKDGNFQNFPGVLSNQREYRMPYPPLG